MNSSSNNIFLIGLMGAGKSTVGKLLAKKLGRRFLDADHVIEDRCGVKIPVIFEMEGEDGFRKREAQAIKDITAEHDVILATGGGAVLLPENRQFLSERGTVIYLHANPMELWHRTKGGEGRPLLKNGDAKKILENLYAIRDPLYREIADYVIETGKPSVNQLVNTLIMQLELSA
ncbi:MULTISPECIES: shikimate kinase [unclassified Polynucleobacter]|uniref:shikimate kinase n=2 Tax=unclassified Polynucleobacter TaxID=2640945 RepID=UPI000BD671EA|nr:MULTISPECIES: shikimate kinase [unclassified Polynucleobacter]MBU3588860.1 shikimate kinase [Polynucleobacter sp. 80A-SIGWE]MBU3591493.1 shikimate kinase [Polynucleobacter sp. 78F-HAINBA]MBU3612625.1 shikimate kinase [Polynucleobacter sp. MG-27-Goln-C1]MBU3637807.1 shikimate kinase [Polynucleobacter sp. es-MAR-4]OYY14840.1 MAG: shikimate kinase [Polynucleobacter sp. 35-46-11]OZA11081.1 MAG: shikimate kinase [Polynucleobacter sp. 24-46-87]OZA74117.1 MAG: shikimate kinase [Polynucleobacter 